MVDHQSPLHTLEVLGAAGATIRPVGFRRIPFSGAVPEVVPIARRTLRECFNQVRGP